MDGLSKIEVVAAFILGFVAGVSALVFLGTEVTRELRSAKAELAGTLERLAQAVEAKGLELKR
jgi:hypothetical protein